MTSSYKRRNRDFWASNRPTSVGIYWSQQYNAYACKWMDTHHFKEMAPVISYFKSKPYGDCVYDPDGRVWYFKEEYLSDVQAMLNAFGPTIFEINFIEKPINNYSNFFSQGEPSVSDYLDKFKQLTNEDLKNLEYSDAKKIYRRICMKMHPDIPGNDATNLSSVNEVWSALERLLYNTKKEPTYGSE